MQLIFFLSYNEAHRLSLRYLKFNLSELVKAAIKVTYQDGARDCELPYLLNLVWILADKDN